MRVLRPLGIEDRFRVIVDAFKAGSSKQDERAFLFALKLAGIHANQAVHVGDQYDRDVLPAQSAGFKAILLDRNGDHLDVNSERIETLAELPRTQQEVLRLAILEQLTPKEIAARTGRSHESVKKAYGRGLSRFTELLDSKRGDLDG